MSPRENDDDSWRASDGNFEHQATAVDQMEAATPQRDEAGVGDATETSSGTNQQSVVEAMDDLALTEVKFFQGDRCMYVAEQGGEEGVQNGGGGNIFALAESAVKARVTSVGSSNYRLALPDGSEVTVPLAHPGLYTIGEYESLRLEGETAAMGIVASGPYGGGGGTPFDDMEVYRGDAGYMHDDPGYQRFFSYISLFTFSMLMLVMSNNFLQLFFGWEAVGLVSYLLIGFWFKRETAIFANLKAFLVNRVGDFGFILGIAGVVMFTGSLDYATVFGSADQIAARTSKCFRARRGTR